MVFEAVVSHVLPLFDPTTRTMKVRLEADNPNYELRPDMFVDVELPIELPATLAVPTDAVLDTGLKKTVFVDRGGGRWESPFSRKPNDNGESPGEKARSKRQLSAFPPRI